MENRDSKQIFLDMISLLNEMTDEVELYNDKKYSVSGRRIRKSLRELNKLSKELKDSTLDK